MAIKAPAASRRWPQSAARLIAREFWLLIAAVCPTFVVKDSALLI